MKPSFDEHARGLDVPLVVGEERPLVADDLELHEVAQAELAREPAVRIASSAV